MVSGESAMVSKRETKLGSLLSMVLPGACLWLYVASTAASADGKPARTWKLEDIVEVARITDIAIRGTSDEAAYIVKTPSVTAGKNEYRLFVVDPRHAGSPRRLLGAAYLADLSWRPGADNWSVRADLGDGVQLYDVADDGQTTAVVSTSTQLVGGSEGLVADSVEEPRQTGVLSYEWSPDGSRLWYSVLRLKEAPVQRDLQTRGLRYDDASMFALTGTDITRSVQLDGTELRIFDPEQGSSRVLAFAPADQVGGGAAQVFRRRRSSAMWVGGSEIQFRLQGGSGGYLTSALYRVNVDTGVTTRLVTLEPNQTFDSVPTSAGILTVKTGGTAHRLIDLSCNGEIIADYGKVAFPRVSGSLGGWATPNGDHLILGVHYADRDGLTAINRKGQVADLSRIPENLSVCAFNANLSFGACSSESVSQPPELVSIRPASAKTETLARPNGAYAAIAPLHTTAKRWINRYGHESSGYLTYPRRYSAAHKYPAIVITHASDARNRFAWDGFQWEYPIQVFAERGYFVLSVNEPAASDEIPAPYYSEASAAGIWSEQQREGYDPLASMEAAAQELVAQGMVDASMVGIAGYSRGASIARFAISHSSVFSAASSGEATWWDAGGYWGGGPFTRNLYKNLLGGAPFDPEAYGAYRQFSASARAQCFSGPLLQQFTSEDAHDAVEMDQLLKTANIPTELYIFPSEAHVLWQPQHRLAALEQNLDWFEYWLRNRRDADPRKDAQYSRWDEMRRQWTQSLVVRNDLSASDVNTCQH